MAWASAALFVAPLMTGLPSVLRLQFSVSAMVMMLVSLWLIARPRLTLNGQTRTSRNLTEADRLPRNAALNRRVKRREAGISELQGDDRPIPLRRLLIGPEPPVHVDHDVSPVAADGKTIHVPRRAARDEVPSGWYFDSCRGHWKRTSCSRQRSAVFSCGQASENAYTRF